MAKTLDELVTETLGAQVFMVLRLQAENAALAEHGKALAGKFDELSAKFDALKATTDAALAVGRDAVDVANRVLEGGT